MKLGELKFGVIMNIRLFNCVLNVLNSIFLQFI
jgi:hypothetical protein